MTTTGWSIEGTLLAKRPKGKLKEPTAMTSATGKWSIETTIAETKKRSAEIATMNEALRIKQLDHIIKELERPHFVAAQKYCSEKELVLTYEASEIEKDLMNRIFPNQNAKPYLENDEEREALANLKSQGYVKDNGQGYKLTELGILYHLSPKFASEEKSQ